MITRHYIRVNGRHVHYRMAGSGPPLLMVHQSPRSSAEYEPLMREWAEHFTCIAPDTPGFGQSGPLQGEPEIEDFADALVELLKTLRLDKVGGYGFHSGGIILVAAAKRHPRLFSALAIGGYAIWTEEEQRIFGERYLPPFRPSDYGEHLAWLWNRMLEQSWFFPWFDVRHEARLRGAHDDPARVEAAVREMLDSGDAYRAGYGAVLRAPRDIPPSEAETPPVLITAYDGDPLQAHLKRLGKLPPSWRAFAVASPAEHHRESLAHLRAHPAPAAGALPEAEDLGFVRVSAAGFKGLVHWRGRRDAERLVLHAPGRAAELIDDPLALLIDLPGHGQSDDWRDGPPASLEAWVEVAAEAIRRIAPDPPATIVGEGACFLLACAAARPAGIGQVGGFAVALPQPAQADGWAARAIPALEPDRFGAYLQRLWAAVRAAHFFFPWFDARADHAVPFEAARVTPERLAAEHRALLNARAGRPLLELLLSLDRAAVVRAAPPIVWLNNPAWAKQRPDVWTPREAEGEDDGDS